jgi:hypothetical protein
MISGSAAVPGGPPATRASPVRNTILSLMYLSKNLKYKFQFDVE